MSHNLHALYKIFKKLGNINIKLVSSFVIYKSIRPTFPQYFLSVWALPKKVITAAITNIATNECRILCMLITGFSLRNGVYRVKHSKCYR